MQTKFLGLALAGSLALVASQASAWSGDLVKCTMTPGIPVDVNFKKGLVCSDTLNKISIVAKVKNKDANKAPLNNAFDGCVHNPAAPWDAWRAGKYGKTSAADAAFLDGALAEVALKGITFGSCNFAGSPVSAGASGGGKIGFVYEATPGKFKKVKGAAFSFFGNVAGDAATFSATAVGLITKGMATGGRVAVSVGLDLTAPENGIILACNTGAICNTPGVSVYEGGDDMFIHGPEGRNTQPAPEPPITVLKVASADAPNPPSVLSVSLGTPDPNDPNDPYSHLP